MSDSELRMTQRQIHRLHVMCLTRNVAILWQERQGLGISVRHMKRLRRKMKERGLRILLDGIETAAVEQKPVQTRSTEYLNWGGVAIGA